MHKSLCTLIAAALLLGSPEDSEAQRHRPAHRPSYAAKHRGKKARGRQQQAPAKKKEAPQQSCEVSADGESLTLYYRTNSWTISRSYLDCLRDFYGKHTGAQRWIVEGHADIRGPADWNDELGRNRATSIEHYLDGFGAQGTINLVSYGALKPADPGNNHAAYRKNRRGIIIAEGEIITEALNRLPLADAYILDATGSMAGQKWGLVRTHAYPQGADTYAFNSCIGVKQTRDLNSIVPNCGTPLWESVLGVLNGSKHYSRITVLTDGEASAYLADDVIRTANAKHTKVSIAGVHVYDKTTRDLLARVASETGGDSYLPQQ